LSGESAIAFGCEAETLFGVLHRPVQPGTRGVVIVVGGPQTRVGSHRQFVLLARALAAAGVAALRFDYRGMGDSSGSVRDFTTIDADIWAGAEIKDAFEALKREAEPDLIFTHLRGDLHQDHRVISDVTWNTFRNHLILEYEIPKYDGDLGVPNMFIPLEPKHCDEKVETLMSCFPSKAGKHWFSRETFMGLMRLRGMECNAPSDYAEAFYCRKAVL
jgi:LmbE family N-acetylglucosaminyl deacetylase